MPKNKTYVSILDLPIEKLTGWMEVPMDIDRIREALEKTRQSITIIRSKQEVLPTNWKKKKKLRYQQVLQAVPMDINRINASFDATLKKE